MADEYRAAAGAVEPSPANIAATARRRIVSRVLPLLFLLYVANYLDRTNIAYATLGMKGDLRLNDSVFGTASGIFFIGYLLLQIPGALLVERWSARRVLAMTSIAWGVLTAATGLVRTPIELYGARFLLGAAEAAFFPGVIVYLSSLFGEQDRAKAIARFMAAIPIAAILGGPVAGAILRVDWFGIAGWRWLFLLEGAPAILLGAATLLLLPDRAAEARQLEEPRASDSFARVSVWQALRHPAVLLLTAALFFCYAGGYAFWFWIPTMLQRLTGWNDVARIGWVGALPFVAGLVGMLVFGWSSDRTGERRWHFAIPQFTAAVALLGWLLLPDSNTLLIAVFVLAGFGTTAHLPSFWALPTSFLSSSAAAAAIGFINCTASIGGFVGPKIVGELTQRSGSFDAGFVVMIACWTVASALVVLCRGERRALVSGERKALQ